MVGRGQEFGHNSNILTPLLTIETQAQLLSFEFATVPLLCPAFSGVTLDLRVKEYLGVGAGVGKVEGRVIREFAPQTPGFRLYAVLSTYSRNRGLLFSAQVHVCKKRHK